MSGSAIRTLVPLIVATLILHLFLIQPNHPGAMTWRALFVFPLELPAILLVLIALPQSRVLAAVRIVLTMSLTVISTLKVADFVSFNALSRGFNPVADFPLVESLFRLLTGAVGQTLAILAIAGAIIAVCSIAALVWWATGVWARVSIPFVASVGVGVAAVAAVGLVTAEIGHVMKRWQLPFDPPGTAFTARVGVERIEMVNTTLAELRAFRIAVREDPFAGRVGLLNAIDRDVIVIFVESYGRTSFDRPFYADLHRETLLAYETELGALGLAMQSGFLTSPTKGGQSWLAHATVSNGLWIDNQIRHAAALSSGRETLFHHAARNGFRTATVMPQITLDWPEADRMGFDLILPAKDLGYAGLPFNWVTMPDQFTLSALDRLVRNGQQTRPQFIQVALASSHAPWVPVPQIIPWDKIGDGQVFNEMALSGDPPEVVWRDRERVRLQYKLAIDYALQAVMEYAKLHAADPPLVLVIGDHQAAEFIALDDRSDVPIHVIGPRTLVDRALDIAPYQGLLPDDMATALPMDRLRDMVLTAFTDVETSEIAQ
jgi:hypothetical protein